MKKFGRATISDVLECAKKEFVNDREALYFVHFDYRGRLVFAPGFHSEAGSRRACLPLNVICYLCGLTI